MLLKRLHLPGGKGGAKNTFLRGGVSNGSGDWIECLLSEDRSISKILPHFHGRILKNGEDILLTVKDLAFNWQLFNRSNGVSKEKHCN